jgi:hypothetical protein
MFVSIILVPEDNYNRSDYGDTLCPTQQALPWEEITKEEHDFLIRWLGDRSLCNAIFGEYVPMLIVKDEVTIQQRIEQMRVAVAERDAAN